MKICALASGSSGNSYYVEEGDSAILVDAGISYKQILLRLDQIKRNNSKIRALFVTHEHSDHIKGADVLARQLNIPIYATKSTIKKSFICSNQDLLCGIKNDETVEIDDFQIQAFSKSHSAADPVSYLISNGKKRALIATDLGYSCKNTIEAVQDSDMVFFESNHDVKMLEESHYLPFHKKWVLSNEGHLSNTQAALTILEHSKQSVQRVVLSHLSKTTNTPQQALSTFRNIIKERYNFNPQISVSNREGPTPLFSA
jgi:phosphoribosyl 1,2-cyclic phosphodiesterase